MIKCNLKTDILLNYFFVINNYYFPCLTEEKWSQQKSFSMHHVGAHPLFLQVISHFLCVFGAKMRGSGNPETPYLN